jgi:hypothetical protein
LNRTLGGSAPRAPDGAAVATKAEAIALALGPLADWARKDPAWTVDALADAELTDGNVLLVRRGWVITSIRGKHALPQGFEARLKFEGAAA